MSRIPPALRRRVRRRADGICEYCRSGSELTGHEFTVDHVTSESLGGGDEFDNRCWCCFWCNSFKQARFKAVDRKTGSMVPLFNPRSDGWDEHFRWSRYSTRIIGKTPTGRATVDALRLNRPVLVRARAVWVRHGLHPPM